MSDQYPTSRDNFSPQAQCRYNLHFLLWNTLNEWKLPPGPKHVLKNNLVNPCEQLLRRPLANLGQDELCSQVSCKEQVLTLLDHNLISEGLVGQSQGQFKLLLAARNIIFFPIPHQHVIIQQIDVWSWSLAHILTMRRGGYPPNNPTNRVFISYKLNPIFRWPMRTSWSAFLFLPQGKTRSFIWNRKLSNHDPKPFNVSRNNNLFQPSEPVGKQTPALGMMASKLEHRDLLQRHQTLPSHHHNFRCRGAGV